jgi:hypothetical protein
LDNFQATFLEQSQYLRVHQAVKHFLALLVRTILAHVEFTWALNWRELMLVFGPESNLEFVVERVVNGFNLFSGEHQGFAVRNFVWQIYIFMHCNWRPTQLIVVDSEAFHNVLEPQIFLRHTTVPLNVGGAFAHQSWIRVGHVFFVIELD